MTIAPCDAEYMVLFNAYEETSLYDIPAELGRYLPNSEELITMSRRAVLSLLQHDLISLYDDSHDSDPLNRQQAEAIIAAQAAWRVPGKSDSETYMALTDAGLRALCKYPGLSRKRQYELTDALIYGPYGAGESYGFLYKVYSWVARERRPALGKYQSAASILFCSWAGLHLGKFTAKWLRILRIHKTR
jgi:hypothetical protein